MVQRICKYCHQTYEVKTGIDNWKNLFRKPTLDDFIVLIILILLVAAAFAYTTETAQCRDTLKNLDQVCIQRMANFTQTNIPGGGYLPAINYTYIQNESKVVEVNSSDDSSSNNSNK